MIEVEALYKHYGNFPALKDVTFSVSRERGVTALLGPNGAGKTTTLRLLTGYLKPTVGTIRIGQKRLNDKNRVAVKQQIGYLPETTPMYYEMLVAEYIRFMGNIRGMTKERLERRFRDMSELLSLGSHLYTPLGLLSKGFRQRVALAGTLIHEPDYIILDEPTSGLDPNQIQQMRQLIRELGKNHTVILSTHILQEAEDICDRAIIIDRGKIVADESTRSLKDAQSCKIVVKGTNIQQTLQGLEIVKTCREEETLGHPNGYQTYLCELRQNSPEKIYASAAANNWDLRELSALSRSLQDVFYELTN